MISFVDAIRRRRKLQIRAERFAEAKGIKLIEGKNYLKETFIWFPNYKPTDALGGTRSYLALYGLRAYYYTSMKADNPGIDAARERLWNLGFTPNVFKKNRKEDKAKGPHLGTADVS